jgi:hypothetical protein
MESNCARGSLFEPPTLRSGTCELELYGDALDTDEPHGLDQGAVILERDQGRCHEHSERLRRWLPLRRMEELLVDAAVLNGDATARNPDALELRGDRGTHRDDVRRKAVDVAKRPEDAGREPTVEREQRGDSQCPDSAGRGGLEVIAVEMDEADFPAVPRYNGHRFREESECANPMRAVTRRPPRRGYACALKRPVGFASRAKQEMHAMTASRLAP